MGTTAGKAQPARATSTGYPQADGGRPMTVHPARATSTGYPQADGGRPMTVQPARATSTGYPQADGGRPMTVQEMDRFETESFRSGSGRYRRQTPAFRPPEDPARTDPENRAAPVSRAAPASRAVPAIMPARQDYQAEHIVRQQTVDRPVDRDPVRTDMNHWLDDNIWPAGGVVAPLTPVVNTDRDRHPPLTAFPPQPPPYQSVEDNVRPRPIGKQGAKPEPATRPPPVAAPTTAPPTNTKQQPSIDAPAQPLDIIQEETPRLDNDQPDFSINERPVSRYRRLCSIRAHQYDVVRLRSSTSSGGGLCLD